MPEGDPTANTGDHDQDVDLTWPQFDLAALRLWNLDLVFDTAMHG